MGAVGLYNGLTPVLNTASTGILARSSAGFLNAIPDSSWNGSVLTLPRSRVLSNLGESDQGYILHETTGRSTDYSQWNIGRYTYLEWEPSASPGTNQGRGSMVTINVPATCDKNIAYLLGQTVDVFHRGSGNIPTLAVGHSVGLNLWGTGTTAAAEANAARISVSQGVLTSGKTVRISAPLLLNGGTIGTLHQLYIESPVIAGVTTKYGIYAESAPHYIAGQTTFNATTGNPLTVQAGGVNALVVDSTKNAKFYGSVNHGQELTDVIGAVTPNVVTVNFTAANMHYVDYSAQDAGCTINLTAPAGPSAVNVLFKCGGSGAVTWTPSAGTIIWSGGTSPDLSTDGVWKVVGFRYSGSYWLGGVSDAFTIPV